MDGPTIAYATSKDWLDIMKNRSRVRMHELIERLGLRAKWSSNKRGKTNFESVLVRELVADMGDVVSTLPKEPDELMKFLSEEGSLKNEVDGLLEKHGSKIWGRNADREHLIAANEPGVEEGVYPRDLYFEEEEDRKLIHKLLHWWIGLKACNVILARERLDRERRKKAENRQARVEAEHAAQHGDVGTPASFVALAPNSVLLDMDTGSRGSPASSSAMLTPPESGESPVVGPREGMAFTFINGKDAINGGPTSSNTAHARSLQTAPQPQNIAEGVWSRFAASERNGTDETRSYVPSASAGGDSKVAVQQEIALANHAAAERQITTQIAQVVANFQINNAPPIDVSHPHGSIPYKGLDYDTLKGLRAYIYDEDSGRHHWDEDTLLSHLERMWRERVRQDLDRIAEDPAIFIARERAFLTWIEMRRHVAAFDRSHQRWSTEGSSAAEVNRRHQQYDSLMRATETILVNYEDIGQGLGAVPGRAIDRDEYLRQAIVILAGEKSAIELQWKPIEFTSMIRWLAEALDTFRKEEEEENRSSLWYIS